MAHFGLIFLSLLSLLGGVAFMYLAIVAPSKKVIMFGNYVFDSGA